MIEKRTRYITRIFTLDRFYHGTILVSWENELEKFLQEENKHYGLKIISDKEEVFISIEYSNIIWAYRAFFGSYKKKYKALSQDDERWIYIENSLIDDLKTIGLSHLKSEILLSLKNKEYFEYNEKTTMQFKRYCI